ncbi:MAG: inositol monophosphatase, partial [Nitrospirae bacterium]
MEAELKEALEVAEGLARAAGAELLEQARRGFAVATKQNAIDLVTDADRAAEAVVV